MSQIKLSNYYIKNIVKLALNEDLYPSGDITSSLVKNKKLISSDTLTSILDKTKFKNRHIDFLSVDAEGKDFEVIQSLDFHRYSPKFICIEIWTETKHKNYELNSIPKLVDVLNLLKNNPEILKINESKIQLGVSKDILNNIEDTFKEKWNDALIYAKSIGKVIISGYTKYRDNF